MESVDEREGEGEIGDRQSKGRRQRERRSGKVRESAIWKSRERRKEKKEYKVEEKEC